MANSIHRHNRISNIVDDHSNTPVVYDGLGPVLRDFPSHPETGFVIFIDTLGVKGIWKRMDPNAVFNRWKSIITQFVDSLQQSPLQQSGPHLTTLSDTIIITCQRELRHVDYLFGFLINFSFFPSNQTFF